MGNFAENLNLGNRFRPPPCCFVLFVSLTSLILCIWSRGNCTPNLAYFALYILHSISKSQHLSGKIYMHLKVKIAVTLSSIKIQV